MNYEGKKKIWSEFQKEIPDDKYFYARSCIRQNFNPGAEQAFLDIVRNRFGKDFYEDPLHTTCGGIAYHSDTTPEECTARYSRPGRSIPRSSRRYTSCCGRHVRGSS